MCALGVGPHVARLRFYSLRVGAKREQFQASLAQAQARFGDFHEHLAAIVQASPRRAASEREVMFMARDTQYFGTFLQRCSSDFRPAGKDSLSHRACLLSLLPTCFSVDGFHAHDPWMRIQGSWSRIPIPQTMGGLTEHGKPPLNQTKSDPNLILLSLHTTVTTYQHCHGSGKRFARGLGKCARSLRVKRSRRWERSKSNAASSCTALRRNCTVVWTIIARNRRAKIHHHGNPLI